ncbi:MAG: hypothetical protein WC959_10125 [Kiritimatiellales bacterium]
MKRKSIVLGILLASGGIASLLFAQQLGLQTILNDQGVAAVGQAVQAAAEQAFASGAEPADIQAQLIAILDEAAATGDENAVNYAIVGVMYAGGPQNLEFTTAVVEQSRAAAQYPEITRNAIAGMVLYFSKDADVYVSGGRDPSQEIGLFSRDNKMGDDGDVPATPH